MAIKENLNFTGHGNHNLIDTLVKALFEVCTDSVVPSLREETFKYELLQSAKRVQRRDGTPVFNALTSQQNPDSGLDLVGSLRRPLAEAILEGRFKKPVSYNGFTYFPDSNQLLKPDSDTRIDIISEKRGKLLQVFFYNGGSFVPYENLLLFAWGHEHTGKGSISLLKPHVCKLRKIVDEPDTTLQLSHIRDSRYFGYGFFTSPPNVVQ